MINDFSCCGKPEGCYLYVQYLNNDTDVVCSNLIDWSCRDFYYGIKRYVEIPDGFMPVVNGVQPIINDHCELTIIWKTETLFDNCEYNTSSTNSKFASSLSWKHILGVKYEK